MMLELIMLSQRVTVAHHCVNVFRQPGSLECLLSPHSQTFSARLSSPPPAAPQPPGPPDQYSVLARLAGPGGRGPA